jgi:hypothetical protein
MKNVLLSDVLLLEGKDGQEWKENPNNCAWCHLPIKGICDLELAMVQAGYKCTIVEKKMYNNNIVVWSLSKRLVHGMLSPPMVTFPKGKWVCPCCKNTIWLMDHNQFWPIMAFNYNRWF